MQMYARCKVPQDTQETARAVLLEALTKRWQFGLVLNDNKVSLDNDGEGRQLELGMRFQVEKMVHANHGAHKGTGHAKVQAYKSTGHAKAEMCKGKVCPDTQDRPSGAGLQSGSTG